MAATTVVHSVVSTDLHSADVTVLTTVDWMARMWVVHWAIGWAEQTENCLVERKGSHWVAN